MKLLTTTIAKFLFALPLLGFAMGHFTSATEMNEMMSVPGGEVMIYITGVALVAAVLGILTGKMQKWAGIGLALFLIITAIVIWLPGMSADDADAAQTAMSMLLKDISIAGGALTYAGLAKD